MLFKKAYDFFSIPSFKLVMLDVACAALMFILAKWTDNNVWHAAGIICAILFVTDTISAWNYKKENKENDK